MTGVIGVALGSGAARGWAHIGVMQALSAIGIKPQVICGSSIGALVAAAHAIGAGTDLEKLAKGLTRRELVRLLDVRIADGGLVGDEKLMRLLSGLLGKPNIEDLPIRFAATATNIRTGQEIWLRTGDLTSAVRTSIAFPGILSPVPYDDQYLADGGLINPVPVSLCRALGADTVIAVNINSNRIGRRTVRKEQRARARSKLVERLSAEMPEPLRSQASRLAQQFFGERGKSIEYWDVLISALNIIQEGLTRGLLRESMPDVLVEPSVNQIGLVEFHRAEEAIYYGQAAVQQAIPQLTERGIPVHAARSTSRLADLATTKDTEEDARAQLD